MSSLRAAHSGGKGVPAEAMAAIGDHSIYIFEFLVAGAFSACFVIWRVVQGRKTALGAKRGSKEVF